MNYELHYDRLIATRQCRKINESEYYETHHIIPKSLGGRDTVDNLVKLTAREHFIAHWLLWRIYRNRQTAYAFKAMCKFRNEFREYNGFSSIAYEEAKLARREQGMSIDSIEKMKNSLRGRTVPDHVKDKIRQSNIGKHSESLKGNKNHLNHKHSDESKDLMRKKKLGVKRKQFTPETIEKMKNVRTEYWKKKRELKDI